MRRAIVLSAIPPLLGAGAAAPAAMTVNVGEAAIAWTTAYASPNEDWINDIVALGDGSFLAVGFLDRLDGESSSDWRALAAKFDADGGSRWTKEYGKGGGIDAFWTAREVDDNRLMFGGFSTRLGPAGINAYFAATTADGALQKENAYGTPGYDRITGLAPTSSGFIGAGHAEGVDGRDVFLIGVDKDGVELWRRVFAEKGANGALYVEPAGDGNFIVAGGTSPDGDADILVMKVDAEGRELWRRVVGAPETDDINHGLVVFPDGRIVVAGYTQSWGAGGRDFMAAVLSSAGATVSIETIGGRGDDRAMLAKADAEGRVWIVGHTDSAGAGGMDAMAALLGADGRFAKEVLLVGGPGDDVGAAVRPLPHGDLLLGGHGESFGGGASDGFVMRLDAVRLKAHPAIEVQQVK